MADNSQKFIGRNRAPRVQIEYDVELYGAEKKVQLPFVMGVMSDLAGKSKAPQPAVADRKFLEIDVDSFDQRMKAMAPRAAFSVPNTLTGEGSLAVDLTFESMADFSPGAIAARVESLRPLLEARTQLQTLMAYMDGKAGAEGLIEHILQTPALMSVLAKGEAPVAQDQAMALGSLRALERPEAVADKSVDVLAALAASAPQETDEAADLVGDTLADLARQQPAAPHEDDTEAAATLSALASTLDSDTETEADAEQEALASLRVVAATSPAPIEPPTEVAAAVLNDLARAGEAAQSEAVPAGSASDSILDELAALDVNEPEDTVATTDILKGLGAVEATSEMSDDDLSDVLDTLAASVADEPAPAEASTDILDSLAGQVQDDAATEDLSQLLGDLAALAPDASEEEQGSAADVLDALSEFEVTAEEEPQLGDILAEVSAASGAEDLGVSAEGDLAGILQGLGSDGQDIPAEAEDDLQGLLDDLTMPEPETGTGDDIDLDDVLAGLDHSDEETEAEAEASGQDALESLLGGLELSDEPAEDESDLDSLLSGLGEMDDPGADDASGREEDLEDLLETATETPAPEEDLDLDDLLGDLNDDLGADLDGDLEAESDAPEAVGSTEAAGLDDLLADLGSDDADDEADDGIGDLDDLLGDLDLELDPSDPDPSDPDTEAAGHEQAGDTQAARLAEPEFAYGTISADRPDANQLTRRRFRIALFGDFSGRAARGLIETGAALAARPAILLDPDTVEEVIEGFASELILPIGKDSEGKVGGGIAVKLSEFDDLHPDELFENVSLFSELVSLRKQLQSGVTVEHASRSLAAWAEQYGTPTRVPKQSSAGNAVPADRRLSAFQQLIGDRENARHLASPIEEMLARIVGPHIRALPNPDVAAMQEAVDAALSDAMRLVLHHPEFQSIEAQWRSLDLIARSVEVDDSLEVVLYDVSAEEMAADLASQDDLAKSGLTQLLTEAPMDPETGRGGYSALVGLYSFEETPPHAELLGRIARVAAHVDAPFFTSLSPEFLKTDKKDRPPLVASAWDTLQGMPEAGHLALASPRFLLRRPYGAKSDPVDAFDFEEFSQKEGLKGMLWGNPAVLVTILLARSFKENGASMQLGSIMSLGDMPFHTVTDRFGDQVALPCTERNIDLDKIAMANARGVMALSAVKGRDELRLTSFSSVAGSEVLGPWTGAPAPEPSPADPREKAGIAAPAATPEQTAVADPAAEPDLDDLGLDDLGLDDLDLEGLGDTDDGLSDLDDLLAGFGDDDAQESGDEDEMDADLAALLADL
jgi:pilus assembly protein FimV